jgi:hypothetical protein
VGKQKAEPGAKPKYFTGLKDPRDEVTRTYDYGGKHPITFPKKVAETAVEGDYYFQKQSSGADRYYVPVPGKEETDLWVVTHVFNGYDWDRYDGDGNVVIPVWNGGGDAKYAAQRGIEQALYDTPLGKALGRDALRPLCQSLAEKFGLDSWDEYVNSDRAFHVNDEDNEGVKTALKELLEFRPMSYWEYLGEMGAECDGVGFAENAEQYNRLLAGETDGFGGEPHEKSKGKTMPLFSQPVLYAVAGSKDDGRTVWARLERLMSLVGLEWKDVRE